MGLATTYIVAMFAIFVSLLSFILSSYGGQVTIRSSVILRMGGLEHGGHGAGHHLHCCHVCHLCVPSLLHSLLLRGSGNYQIIGHPKDGRIRTWRTWDWPPPTLLPCLPSLCPFSPSFLSSYGGQVTTRSLVCREGFIFLPCNN
jgi:hypothetical protein